MTSTLEKEKEHALEWVTSKEQDKDACPVSPLDRKDSSSTRVEKGIAKDAESLHTVNADNVPLFPKRRQESGIYAKLTFAYMNSIIKTGVKRDLGPDDYMPVEDADNSEALSTKLIQAWEAEMERAKKSPKGPSLTRAVASVFGWAFLWPGLVSLLETFVKIGEALMLGVMLRWFQDPNGTNTAGYLYALALSGCVLVHAVLHHIEFFLAMRVGMQVRIAFIATIYRKCLALSISHTSSTGLIVNLVSNDVQRFEDATPFAHFIWLGPLEVLLILYFMYLEISFAAFAAVAALLAIIPIQGGFAKQFSSLRKQTVGFRDDRIKSISDSLAGIQVVKLYAWEEPFKKAINGLRDQEMRVVRKASMLRALNEAFYFASPAVIQIFAFLTYWLMGGELTPARVFTCIVYLSVIQLSMTNFYPKALQFISESKVSMQRIQAFLSLPEMTSKRNDAAELAFLDELHDPSVDIVIRNGNFAWGGSGLESQGKPKTVLRDLEVTVKKGDLVAVVGPVGAGKSSLLNALLGEMDPIQGTRMALRSRKIAYCTQQPFILSGTIKDNITFGLAFHPRKMDHVIHACAMDTDVALFADGLETVIGERGVTLSGGQRARLALARAVYSDADVYLLDDPLSAVDTKVGRQDPNSRHPQLQFARRCTSIVLLEDGAISAQGDYTTIINAKSSFAGTMKEMDLKSGDTDEDDLDVDALTGVSNTIIIEDSTNTPTKPSLIQQDATNPPNPKNLIKQEESAKGSVPLSTYLTFFRLGSTLPVALFVILLLILGQGTAVMTNWYLSRWSLLEVSAQRVGRAVMFFTICLNATEMMFRGMLGSVLRCSMGFFQENPHGRLMNRFSKDLSLSDEMLPLTFFDFIQCFFMIVGTFAIAVGIIRGKYYIASSRQIKRYEAVTRSPVYSNIPATLEGLSTIRAFGNERAFSDTFIRLQNENTRIYFCFLSAARWLGFRLDVLAAFFLIVVAFLAVGIRGTGALNPGVVGLLLSYGLQLMGLLQWAVRQSAEVENLMVSVERWPTAGEISITNMSMKYPNVERSVLKNINVSIPGGTKVGVVGRTGAGKSSLLQALFRLVEPTPANSIIIDSIPTTSLGLQDLRSRISIIPQEPFCFKGTLRFNLDPFGKYDDAALWTALDVFVAENGSNWSVGERQLICLARAILRDSKLIVMDEATSAVDMRTDALVQKAIRSEDGLFATSTVLTIAHRLQTVIDFDKILVLNDGQIVEYGSPHELLQKDVADPSAWFCRMVAETSPETQQQLRAVALDKFSKL
ncbi:P-loop containing nucleoside triphosphate hydrolase protein [Chytridium lagenaria]|nr:P-loop containing nucleoside triphosphate hydrolase protein [Chytridium lagenaria]